MAERNVPLMELTPSLPTEDDTLTLPEARECLKTKFATYHKLLDEKESKLLAELELLEETNKPEREHVRSDLLRLRGSIDSLDEILGTNTLKVFYEKQKSLWEEQIRELERSESSLSLVKLNISDEKVVENLININPYLSKTKFASQLAPLLELEPQLGEDWYVVCNKWFSEFTDSINLTNPQQNDSWEFPVKIPIQSADDTNNVKLLHSKAWDMLLAFNGLSDRSTPFKTRCCLNPVTQKIEIPRQTTKHDCTIGYNNGNNKFSIEWEIETLPHETYEDILGKLSGFSTLFTDYPPILYTFDARITISCNTPDYTQYTARMYPRWQCRQRAVPVQNIKPSVGNIVRQFLVVIPDSRGHTPFTVRK